MAKQHRVLDVVVYRRPHLWLAHVLGHDDVAAVGQSEDEALTALTKLAARVLRREPSFGDQRGGALHSRHLRLSVPAERLGRLIPLEIQLFVVCGEQEDGWQVDLPQLGMRWTVADLEELEAMAAERIRDECGLSERLEWLLPATGPLVQLDVHGDNVPVMSVRQLSVKFKADPSKSGDADDDETPILSAVGDQLNARMRRKDSPRAFERRGEVQTLLEYIADSAERNVLLVGPPGVGKSAIVNEAAYRAVHKEAPAELHDVAFWQVSGGRMLAGTQFLGEWQERVLEVIKEVKATGAILFVENLIELLETAGTDKHSEGVPGLLLPHMLAGEVVVVTECHPEQVARAEQTHPSFLRAFRRLPVEPMNPLRTEEVLTRVSYRLGRQFGVRLADETRERILELVGRFPGVAELPGPAVELAERLARTHRNRGVIQEEDERPVLLPEHALDAYASLTGLPRMLLDTTAEFSVGEVKGHFDSAVFDQPEANEAMVDLVTSIRAGLNSPKRPLGSYLFLGPTGVGKTQTALTLAQYLFGSSDRLVRLDMSEYQDAWSAGRLVGRYKGERGELVRRVREQPFQVLLLDEIEKAHSNVFDFLLQVLGEGRLTDGLGHTVSLTSTVVIMTSNLGAGGPSSLGFAGATPEADRRAQVTHYLGAVEKFFRPEFVGRIDRVIPFRSLGSATAKRLVEKALAEAFGREGLVRRGVRVSARPEVVEFLIEVGLDERYGARPLRRAVENYITATLAEFLSRESGSLDITLEFHMNDGLPAMTVVR